MAVTKDQVKHLGWLSRIELTEDELERNTGHIEDTVKYLDTLDSVSLSEAEAISLKKRVVDLRDDVPAEFGEDPLGTKQRKDGYVKGPRMT